ncbi:MULTISPECIES: hypothetical protein [Bacillaceae]|uniref:Yip1 domain-containing protein n=1 Tax=Evansella alkalicola TaxID=745819 RepID=A0ABS6JPX4_9BACI|nr:MULTISPECIES: hypothetical protein [Bacillaceae]MBU9720609.1 hypothetical protein [Bacillus alkalicola]
MTEENKHSFMNYTFQLLKNPDTIITKEFRGYHHFGLINIISLVCLIFIHSLLQGLLHMSEDPWYVIQLTESIKVTVSYLLPLCAVILLMNWIATKVIDKNSLSYYTEKLGAVLFYSNILLITSMVFQYYNVSLHLWMTDFAYSFISFSMFIVSYLFAARDNFKISFLLAISFYFTTKLIYYVL